MGNQLSAVAPVQILPVEHYLTELNHKNPKELEFKKILTSTRFFKVVKCISDEGPIVVKVFVIHDSSLNLTTQQKKIKDVYKKLVNAPNCLPFHRTEITDKAAYLTRPFISSTLYDRVSTRPFLTYIEKKWLAFQLLNGLHQCHSEQIYHGDIKLENVLVTSWSWVLLSDFATFKPVYLPHDNPTDYTYFYDTSRRRVCHIAPERFKPTGEDGQLLLDKINRELDLNPPMDIFSVGSVLMELFTESVPFNLHQLLTYRSGTFYPDIVSKIPDDDIKNMIEQMIQMNPEKRMTASYYLEQQKGIAFPEVFYSFLWPFCKQFAQSPGIPADERINRVEEAIPRLFEAFNIKPCLCQSQWRHVCKETQDLQMKEPLIVIISIITSAIRSLHFSSSKLTALELLSVLSRHVSDEVIVDRVLPYILNLLKDNDARVRAEAVFALSQCLGIIASVPRSEVNIFPEYIFPLSNDITLDESVIVRQAEANNIGALADTAFRFIDYCYRSGMIFSRTAEREMIYEIIQQKLAKLFSDHSNIVKRTLIEKAVNTLCVNFGKDKTNEFLLSHLITYLNEKKDYHLRHSFFLNITGIASYMGRNCALMLVPLLSQGLSDTEELVVIASLNAMASLVEMGHFPKDTIYQLLRDTAPLLVHPNTWIRLGAVGYIVTASPGLTFLELLTVVSNAVEPFITKKIVQFNKEECILSQLKDPLPRDVYDTLVKSSDVNHILEVLEREVKQGRPFLDLSTISKNEDQQTRNVLRRLCGSGLTEEHMRLLPHLKDHLIKVHRYKKTVDTMQTNIHLVDSTIIDMDVEAKKTSFIPRRFIFPSTIKLPEAPSSNVLSQSMQKSGSMTMNEEWQTMFGNISPEENFFEPKNANSAANKTSSNSTSSSQSFMLDQSQMDKSINMSKCLLECQEAFQELMNIKREEVLMCIQSQKAASSSYIDGTPLSEKWKPKGHLIAHMQEHKAAIMKLIVLRGSSLFASCSKDGTVKVWDCNKTERTYPINRSKYTYSRQGGLIKSMAYCSMQECIAASSDKATIHVFKVETQNLCESRTLKREEDGYAMEMQYMDAGSQSLLTYSTMFGRIVGWDLRSPTDAWVIENGVRKGVITSFAIDPANNWLACGTSSGINVCYDLRFMLPISQIKHPYGQAVQKLTLHPTKPSWIVSSVRTNNEVIFWDLETQSRTKTLWASNNPPFGNPSQLRPKQTLENWVCGLLTCHTEAGEVFAVTAGTDSRIRYWDLDAPERSYIISHPAIYSSLLHHTYESQVIDGSEVIIERVESKALDSNNPEEAPRRTNDQPPTGHIETITDIILMMNPQKMLVSSGFDGTIKMWK